ncbi:peroxidasin homolog [Limulus polyphemus]|uniref:Peroxidasin homolog n=1 Tax=Limulus polyphemus TaxID=6850 RepID=A0ABM1TIW6_LIMPO|nr:peroxidasin homolog [Limulus polyphemus]
MTVNKARAVSLYKHMKLVTLIVCVCVVSLAGDTKPNIIFESRQTSTVKALSDFTDNPSNIKDPVDVESRVTSSIVKNPVVPEDSPLSTFAKKNPDAEDIGVLSSTTEPAVIQSVNISYFEKDPNFSESRNIPTAQEETVVIRDTGILSIKKDPTLPKPSTNFEPSVNKSMDDHSLMKELSVAESRVFPRPPPGGFQTTVALLMLNVQSSVPSLNSIPAVPVDIQTFGGSSVCGLILRRTYTDGLRKSLSPPYGGFFNLLKPGPIHYDGPVEEVCIRYTDVNLALAEAKRRKGSFKLTREEIMNGLPMIDTSRTDIWNICPAHVKPVPCTVERHRTYTGICNNVQHSSWGTTHTQFVRFLPPAYADGISAPRISVTGGPLPPARVISTYIHPDVDFPSGELSVLVMSWGQFIDHDMTLAAVPRDERDLDFKCCGIPKDLRHPNCMPIEIPPDDPFYSHYGQHCMEFKRLEAGQRPGCTLGYDMALLQGYWNGYDDNVHMGMANSFQAAAFRFGHTHIQGMVRRYNKYHEFVGEDPLRILLRQPYIVYEPGKMDELIGGLINTPAQTYDPFITMEVTNHLFEEPPHQFGMDLIAFNIMRGRETGVPGYNDFRHWCGLGRAKTFEELEPYLNNRTAFKYAQIYKHPDDIDLWSGGVSERRLPGAMIGPTFACIIARQFDNVRRGDRYWYENSGFPSAFTPDQVREIKKSYQSKLICENADDMPTIQLYAMRLPHPIYNPRLPCRDIPSIDLRFWQEDPIHGGYPFKRK